MEKGNKLFIACRLSSFKSSVISNISHPCVLLMVYWYQIITINTLSYLDDTMPHKIKYYFVYNKIIKKIID